MLANSSLHWRIQKFLTKNADFEKKLSQNILQATKKYFGVIYEMFCLNIVAEGVNAISAVSRSL